MASAVDHHPKKPSFNAVKNSDNDADDQARTANLKARYSSKAADTSPKAKKAMSKPMKKGPLA